MTTRPFREVSDDLRADGRQGASAPAIKALEAGKTIFIPGDQRTISTIRANWSRYAIRRHKRCHTTFREVDGEPGLVVWWVDES